MVFIYAYYKEQARVITSVYDDGMVVSPGKIVFIELLLFHYLS